MADWFSELDDYQSTEDMTSNVLQAQQDAKLNSLRGNLDSWLASGGAMAGSAGAGAAGAAGSGAMAGMGSAFPPLLAASMGAQVVDTALQFKPTKTDKFVKGEVERYEQEGPQGLSAEDRLLAESMMLDPVRAQATENRMRDESMMAAQGGGASAADLQRAQTAQRQQISGAMQNAGQKIFAADMQRKMQEADEYMQNIAYMSERDKQKRQAVSNLLAGGAQLGGQMAAGSAQMKPAAERSAADNVLLNAYGGGNDADLLELFRRFQELERTA